MPTPQHSGDEREDGVDSPAPPPPPPPPPPQDEVDDRVPSRPPPLPASSSSSGPGTASSSGKPKRVDYRELFALFHAPQDDHEDPIATKDKWDHLWQLALAEARDEFRAQQQDRKRQKRRGTASDSDHATGTTAPTPTRSISGGARPPTGSMSGPSGGSGVSNADKRPRPPGPNDSDPNKSMRLNRQQPPPSRPKGGATSKLMQKLGGSR